MWVLSHELTRSHVVLPDWKRSTQSPSEAKTQKLIQNNCGKEKETTVEVWHKKRKENILTKYTWSKISVGLSIWPRIRSISLSINSLYSLRLQLICCSSSLRIWGQGSNMKRFTFLQHCLHGRGVDLAHTSFEVMFSRSWNVMMLRSLALMRDSVLSRSVGLHIMSQYSAAVWMKISSITCFHSWTERTVSKGQQLVSKAFKCISWLRKYTHQACYKSGLVCLATWHRYWNLFEILSQHMG